MRNIFETVISLEYFKNLVKIIEKAEMAKRLSREGPFTLFGPHDGAFGTYTTYDADDLAHEYIVAPLEEIISRQETALRILNHLLVLGRLPLSDLLTRTSITALDGNDIPIDITNGNIIVGNSSLMNSDIGCTNGIIHVTGEVLQPTLLAIKKPAS
jgi:uncharacterized surface protein with fasciclin (FAS1) repeats